MTLVVQTPPGYEAERRYILDVVLADRLGLPWRLRQHDRADVRITLDGDPDGPSVSVPETLFGTPPEAWLRPASLPAGPLPVLRVDGPGSTALRTGQRIPVVVGAPSPGRDGTRVGVDVFGGAFLMLTRYEEAVRPVRDVHDRFPAAASPTGAPEVLRSPVVDAYVELLWAALERAWPRLRRRARRFAVLLTHDVDDPLASLGRGPLGVARQFAADVVLRRDVGLAARRARALVARGTDPHDTFDLLAATSERHGLASAFYFQAHRRRGPAAPYALEHPFLRGLLRGLSARGHEIGFHAGFGTHRDAARTAAEFGHLREVAEREGVRQDRWGGRQHFLQWTPGTWRNWDDAGLAYDCTVAYADAAGFRTGTCHEYRVFDLRARRALELRERPFQVMDVTLSDYLGLTPDDAVATAVDVARECRRYGGSVGVLWHNDSLRTARAKRHYSSLVEAVVGVR